MMKIDLQCWAFVASNFASFCNPRMRGDKFKWENFPDMMERICETTILVSLYHLDESVDGETREDIEEYIKKTAKNIAERLVKNMTE